MNKTRASGFGIAELPRIIRGSGSYLYDAAGKRYVDGSGGPAVFSLGHAHPEVNAAIMRQLNDIAYGYRYLFTSSALEDLTAKVLKVCGGYKDILYSSSGSEAVESALKIALQHFTARGLPHKRHFIARDRSWHGNTLGALSVSGYTGRIRGSAAEASRGGAGSHDTRSRTGDGRRLHLRADRRGRGRRRAGAGGLCERDSGRVPQARCLADRG
jgi:adenosylmethionine-8-amino-7-oxononanoate aminotransferase